jgi:formimidoylglutamate deiminase
MSALGLAGGALRQGEPADFLVVDLDDPALAGAGADDLAAAAVFGMQRTAIRDVYVGGRPIVREGRTGAEAQVVGAFRAAMRRLWTGER